MKLEAFGKEAYEITLDDFKKVIDEKLKALVGIDVMKNGGIAKVVKEAVEDVLSFTNIEVDNTLFKIYCPSLGEDDMEKFGRALFSYKEDKRKRSGTGTVINEIHFEYTIDVSKVDGYICNIPQVLSYDIAKKKKERLEAEIEELQEKIKKNKEYILQYEDIMRSERYE